MTQDDKIGFTMGITMCFILAIILYILMVKYG